MPSHSSSPFESPMSEPQELSSVEALLEHFGQLEAQLLQVRQSLAHSHRLATLGTIATVIAHEYNNILTPVASYAQFALAHDDDVALMKKALEKAMNGAERAAGISASLLGFAKQEDQNHAAHLPTIVREATNCLARDPKKDRVQLSVQVPEVIVAISSLNLQQVLINLMLNARKAMQANGGGQLIVSAKSVGHLVQIDVADTGPGIPPEIRDRLFEPFVTRSLAGSAASAPSTAACPGTAGGAGGGTGLGLSICRDLIQAAGGQIAFETETGKGTIFHITLPMAEELLADPQPPARAA